MKAEPMITNETLVAPKRSKSSRSIEPSMFRLDLKLNSRTRMIGLLYVNQLITVLYHMTYPQISVASVIIDTQQQQQQKRDQLLTPLISNFTEHSRVAGDVQRETPAPIYSNSLETYTRNTEPVAEDNTRVYNSAGDDEFSTEGFVDPATDSSHQTADPIHGTAREWLNKIGSEDGVRAVTDPSSSNLKPSWSSASSGSIKTRRHTDNYLNPDDWWTKLASKQPTSKTFVQMPIETKSSGAGSSRIPINNVDKSAKRGTNDHEQGRGIKRVVPNPGIDLDLKRVVYKEQPLNQNVILTIRYQLRAIRSQHKTLVTRSMHQLQQLDNKLVESYKLCFKKKMPLYAGMLYRTRDFVVRMAKDVNHEKRVLEAMVKQVQKVLRQKMTNQTLVREYNQLVASSTEQSLSGASDTPMRRNYSQNINKRSNHSSRSATTTPTSSSINLTNVKSASESHERDTEITTRKSKPTRYVISVNELNLKKELKKIQALIDRVNGSCYELSSVVDDINYLFKLTVDHSNKKGSFFNTKMTKLNKFYGQQDMAGASASLTPEQHKRGKKLLKSPIRIFFERYGKLTMSTSEGTLNANTTGHNNVESISNVSIDPPEMKSLFEPSSLTYSDPTDHDMGFDDAMTPNSELIETRQTTNSVS